MRRLIKYCDVCFDGDEPYDYCCPDCGSWFKRCAAGKPCRNCGGELLKVTPNESIEDLPMKGQSDAP